VEHRAARGAQWAVAVRCLLAGMWQGLKLVFSFRGSGATMPPIETSTLEQEFRFRWQSKQLAGKIGRVRTQKYGWSKYQLGNAYRLDNPCQTNVFIAHFFKKN